jgi:hypothetical protein
MKQERRVETVEEFKLRIAAIIRRKPEHIPGAPGPNPLLVRPKKRAKSRKARRRWAAKMHVYEVRPRKGLTPNDSPPVHAVSRKDIGCAPLKPQR